MSFCITIAKRHFGICECNASLTAVFLPISAILTHFLLLNWSCAYPLLSNGAGVAGIVGLSSTQTVISQRITTQGGFILGHQNPFGTPLAYSEKRQLRSTVRRVLREAYAPKSGKVKQSNFGEEG